jgi:hypothetical protein
MSKYNVDESIKKLEAALDNVKSTIYDIDNADVPNLDQINDEISSVKSAVEELSDIDSYSISIPTSYELEEAKVALTEALELLRENAEEDNRAKNLFIENINSIHRQLQYIEMDMIHAFTNSYHMNNNYNAFKTQEFYDKITQFITLLTAENVKALHQMMYAYFTNRETVEDKIPVIEVTTLSEINRSGRNQ